MANGPVDRIEQRLKHITADLKRYAEKRLELLVVDVGEQYARWVANSTQKFAGFVFLFGALVFLMIALALYIGALLGSRSLGFVVVSIPMAVLGCLFVNLKPRGISRMLKSEFEGELLAMLKANRKKKDEHDKLIGGDTHEQLKEKEYNE